LVRNFARINIAKGIANFHVNNGVFFQKKVKPLRQQNKTKKVNIKILARAGDISRM